MIKIPIPDVKDAKFVEFYPDELPADVNDLEEVLQDTIAPLSVWYSSAIEYYRQGMLPEFEHVLGEIHDALNTETAVIQKYKSLEFFEEGMLQILHALAADSLNKVSVHGFSKEDDKFKRLLGRADLHDAGNPYTYLLKGFRAIKEKDYKLAKACIKNCLTSSQNSSTSSRYDYAISLGFGIISYFEKAFQSAMEYFTTAIETHPNAHPSVRVAFAACCFELKQYDRCRLAVERALHLEPSNVDALLLLALLERVSAQKDKENKSEHYTNAYEYCMLASHMDKSNAMALNHIAQYLFFTWKKFDSNASIIDQREIQCTFTGECNLGVGDGVRINGGHIDFLEDVRRSGSSYILILRTPLSASLIENIKASVEVKELNHIKNIATRALKISKVDAINAESHYILGRLFHFTSNTEGAVSQYEQCLSKSTDMPLALFGLGQILMSRQRLEDALKLFEQVNAKYPEDRDSSSFIILINSRVKETLYPFEKLKDTVIGFTHEADIWQLQGFLRRGLLSEVATAVKCYEHAVSAIRGLNKVVPSAILCNLSTLYFASGVIDSSMDTARLALLSAARENNDSRGTPASTKVFLSDENSLFNSAETLSVPCTATSYNTVLISDTNITAEGQIASGDCVYIDGSLLLVSAIEESVVILAGFSLLVEGTVYSIEKKQAGNVLSEATLTHSFNYARLLEETGCYGAAEEIYEELVRMHPSYFECCISRIKGHYKEALKMFNKSAEYGGSESGMYMLMGDVYTQVHQLEHAKKSFEKDQQVKSARWRLVMGNFYFGSLYTQQCLPNLKYDESLKQSYKFYYNVLDEDKSRSNIFATNGLGMVCAEKGEFDAAREIFTKIREVAPENQAALINLAHVYLHQERYADAIHSYQTALKTAPQAMKCELLEYLALALYKNKQHEDAVEAIQRAIAINPSSCLLHFNLAHLRQDYALKILHKPKSSKDIECGIDELTGAMKSFVTLQHNSDAKHKLSNKMELIKALENFCKENIEKAGKAFSLVRKDEDAKRAILEQQEKELKERLDEMKRIRAAELEEEARQRKEMEDKALEKMRLTEQLQESWAASSAPAAAADKEKKGKGNKKRKDASQDDSESSEREEIKKGRSKKKASKVDSGESDADGQRERKKVPKAKRAKKEVGYKANIFDSDEDSDNNDSNTGPLYNKRASAVPPSPAAEKSTPNTGGRVRSNKAAQADSDDDDVEFETLTAIGTEARASAADVADEDEDEDDDGNADEDRPANKVRRMLVDDDEN